MTTQQSIIIQRIEDQLAAERITARRATSVATLRAAALERAGELALLGRFQESRRVLELNYFTEED